MVPRNVRRIAQGDDEFVAGPLADLQELGKIEKEAANAEVIQGQASLIKVGWIDQGSSLQTIPVGLKLPYAAGIQFSMDNCSLLAV